MIHINNISKNLGDFSIDDISLNIKENEILGIVGESGAGKSSLIRIMTGLMELDSGQVIIDGKDISRLNKKEKIEFRRSIGVISQNFNILYNYTVWENVHLPFDLRSIKNSNKVDEALSFVNLSEKAAQYPFTLSGGEKQRVAIARAMVMEPKILFCDEPCSSLDYQSTQIVLNYILDIHKRYNSTIIFVSHQLDIIRSICSRAALIDNGRLVEIIDLPPNSIEEPAKTYLQHCKRYLL